MNRRRLISIVGSSTVLVGCIDRTGEADGGEGGSNADGTSDDERTDSTESDANGSDGVGTDDVTGRNGIESGSTGGGDRTNGSESDGGDDSGDDAVSGIETRNPPECDGSLRLPSGMFDEVEHDRIETTGGGTFELVADPETVALSEELSVTLRFVGDDGDEDGAMTGNDEKFTVERETDDGWTSIYRLPEYYGWNDIGITKPDLSPPATWFEWSFELTRERMEHSTELNTPYAVCDPLEPGTYRFVYWGVTTPAERESDWETEYAIGVEFQVTD